MEVNLLVEPSLDQPENSGYSGSEPIGPTWPKFANSGQSPFAGTLAEFVSVTVQGAGLVEPIDQGISGPFLTLHCETTILKQTSIKNAQNLTS